MDKPIIIGKIVAAQGIKGEVKLWPFTDDFERFSRLKQVYLLKDSTVRQVHIQAARVQKNMVILSLDGVTDRTAAENLKDWELAIEEGALEQLPEGRYYIYQLVGLKVFTLDQQELGVLCEVLQTGANDVYVVKNPQNKELLIPALKRVVKKIDLEQREMWIDPLPGLFD